MSTALTISYLSYILHGAPVILVLRCAQVVLEAPMKIRGLSDFSNTLFHIIAHWWSLISLNSRLSWVTLQTLQQTKLDLTMCF